MTMRFVMIGGFLGAGKTTTIGRLAALYQMVDKITEPEKYGLLTHHFAVKSDRDKMTALFEAVLAAQQEE